MQILLPDSKGIEQALSILRDGGVIAHATETCYGLACDLGNPDAVKKLFAIKQRPTHQPVSALFESLEQAKQYVEWNEEADELAKKYLPGPLTLILRMKSQAPRPLFPIPDPSPSPTLGVRISSHPLAQQLVSAFGSPLSTTSANLHGQSNPYSSADILSQFTSRNSEPGTQHPEPDILLDSGPIPMAPPSTVIDLTGGNSGVLRRGEIGLN